MSDTERIEGLKQRLVRANIDINRLTDNDISGLLDKGADALDDWIKDNPFIIRKTHLAKTSKITLAQAIEKNFNYPIAIDNIILSSAPGISKLAQSLLHQLYRQAETSPAVKIDIANRRGYALPVVPGVEIKAQISTLKRTTGARTLAHVRAGITELLHSTIVLKKVDKKRAMTYQAEGPWLTFAGEDLPTGTLTFVFNTDLFHRLAAITKQKNFGFTKNIWPPQNFKFVHALSFRLYELSMQWLNIGQSETYPTADFKNILGCPAVATNAFNSRMLSTALTEVNERLSSFFRVEIKKIKEGRRIVAYKMILWQANQIKTSKKLPPGHEDMFSNGEAPLIFPPRAI